MSEKVEVVKKLSWVEQYKLNYEGKSDEAREIEEFLKSNYKGNKYIPWAVMERMTYMQDPDADFEMVRNSSGGFVHTDMQTNIVVSNKESQNDKTVVEKSNIEATFFSHFVIVVAKFLGKTVTVNYPIQDNAYNAPKIYDSNMVNKSLQRAKAKAASSITGLGYKLYEGADLQFEDDGKTSEPVAPTSGNSYSGSKIVKVEQPKTETVKPETKVTKVTKKEPTPKVAEPTEVTPSESVDDKFIELANEIKNDERFDVGLARFAGNLKATIGSAIDRNVDTVEEIADKLSKIMSLDTFMGALRRQSKVDAK